MLLKGLECFSFPQPPSFLTLLPLHFLGLGNIELVHNSEAQLLTSFSMQAHTHTAFITKDLNPKYTSHIFPCD